MSNDKALRSNFNIFYNVIGFLVDYGMGYNAIIKCGQHI